jgi:predicted benzoate:H+ symporter BenE
VLKRINDSGNEATPEPLAPRGPATFLQRLGLYLFALAVLGGVVAVVGSILFSATQCSGPEFDGECDLAGLVGIWYGIIAVVVGAIVIALVELARALRAP